MGRRLTDEEKAIIPLMRADGITYSEIGKRLGVHKDTVWRHSLSPQNPGRTNGETYDETHAHQKVFSPGRKKPTKLTKEQIAAIPEMKAGGASYKEIGELLGVTLGAARAHGISLSDPSKTNLELWLEIHKESNREYYRNNFVGSVREGKFKHSRSPGKRPRPEDEACELCSRIPSRLHYHHWDDEDYSKGMWLCVVCHMFGEGIDKGCSEGAYYRLKDRIDRESVKMTSLLVPVIV